MKIPEATFFEWKGQFNSETDYLNHIKKMRWANGFMCPRCSCEHGYELQLSSYMNVVNVINKQSVTADTLFHGSRIPLIKWFWAIF